MTALPATVPERPTGRLVRWLIVPREIVIIDSEPTLGGFYCWCPMSAEQAEMADGRSFCDVHPAEVRDIPF